MKLLAYFPVLKRFFQRSCKNLLMEHRNGHISLAMPVQIKTKKLDIDFLKLSLNVQLPLVVRYLVSDTRKSLSQFAEVLPQIEESELASLRARVDLARYQGLFGQRRLIDSL